MHKVPFSTFVCLIGQGGFEQDILPATMVYFRCISCSKLGAGGTHGGCPK